MHSSQPHSIRILIILLVNAIILFGAHFAPTNASAAGTAQSYLSPQLQMNSELFRQGVDGHMLVVELADTVAADLSDAQGRLPAGLTTKRIRNYVMLGILFIMCTAGCASPPDPYKNPEAYDRWEEKVFKEFMAEGPPSWSVKEPTPEQAAAETARLAQYTQAHLLFWQEKMKNRKAPDWEQEELEQEATMQALTEIIVKRVEKARILRQRQLRALRDWMRQQVRLRDLDPELADIFKERDFRRQMDEAQADIKEIDRAIEEPLSPQEEVLLEKLQARKLSDMMQLKAVEQAI